MEYSIKIWEINYKMKKNVLVTGAAGFIGSHVVDSLITLGYKVISLDDLSNGFVENVNLKSTFVKGSIEDVELINKLFRKYKFKFVFHLAAYAAEGLSHFIKRFNYQNNLIGSINLINASINTGSVECFVFTSSIAVYGENQLPMREDVKPMPEDPYGIAKYAVELDLKESKKMFGLNYIIFRPHNVYGERQNIGDKYRNVLGIFMNQILKNEDITIFGNGEQTRAFTYIGDVAPIIANSIEIEECYNEILNIGADKPYSINELVKIISNEMEIQPKICYLEARNEVINAFSSHKKARKYFGKFFTNISLQDGVRRMVKYVKSQGPKGTSLYKNIEVYKNLPNSWK